MVKLKEKGNKLFDIHSHVFLCSEDFDKIILESVKKGVLVVENGLDNEYNNFILKKLEELNRSFLVSLGFHPINFLKYDNVWEEFNYFINSLYENEKKFVAIGEVGMDFYKEGLRNFYKDQVNMFEKILDVALDLDKPVIVHSRSAERCVLSLLEKYIRKGLRVCLHCYLGNQSIINNILKSEYVFFSIPPSINRISNFRSLCKKVGLERILLETDSPFMSPNKGEENRPWNVEYVVKELEIIFERSRENLLETLWENFKAFLM